MLKIIVVFVAVFLMVTIIFLVLISLEKICLENFELGLALLFFIIDIAYISLVAVTYGYILLVYRRQLGLRKNHKKAKEKNHFNLLVPSFIIITFIIFIIVPDLLRTSTVFGIIPAKQILSHSSSILYKIGWLVHPLIYIFSWWFLRKH